MIKIQPTFDPIFREARNEKEMKTEVAMSEEEANDNEFGGKKIKLLNKKDGQGIGSISFDYIEEGGENFIKVRFIGVDSAYGRNDLSLELYRHLISLAQQKNLSGICSDEVVQSGALASWKKLQGEGYNLTVAPQLASKYEDFCKTYDEGKYYKDQLATGNGKSVFTISI